MLVNDFITSSSPISKYQDRADNTNSHFTLNELAAISRVTLPYRASGFISCARHSNSLAALTGKQSIIMFTYDDTFMSALWLQKTIFPPDLPTYPDAPELPNVPEYQAQFGQLHGGPKEAGHFKSINFALFLKQVNNHARTVWPNETGLKLVHGA